MTREQIATAARWLLAWVLVLWALGLALVLFGCGPSTTEIRTAYQAQVQTCLDAEAAIVARRNTTAAQDMADLATERDRCDRALQAIRDRCGRACR